MMLKMGCWRRPTHTGHKVGSRITGAGPWSGAIWPLTPKHENRARSGGRYPGQGLPAKLYGRGWARVPAGLIFDFPENYRSRGSRLASSAILVLLGAAIAIAIAIAFASNSLSACLSALVGERQLGLGFEMLSGATAIISSAADQRPPRPPRAIARHDWPIREIRT